LAEETGMRGEFPRGSEEFSRVLAFSDGMFAIAMTLLVVGIGVPALSDGSSESDLLDAYDDLKHEVLSFFISFAVIGRYWVAHHQFFRLLRAMDYGLVWLNVVYLGFIAFLPFPTALIGNYFENAVAVGSYAVAVAVVSGMEVVLFRRAYRAGLIRGDMPETVYRWGVLSSSLPVAFFLLSVPIAFLSTAAAALCWFLPAVGGLLLNRSQPAEANEWF
jgi:uncharacterized membrane protein